MFFSQQRTALIRQAKVYAGVSLPPQEAWQSPPQKTQLWCLLFEALDCNISLLPHFLPYYITVGEEWQWKLWQHGSEWFSKWTALCMAVGLFSAPCLRERMVAVSSQMLATAGPLQTISGTMLSSGWVPACVSIPHEPTAGEVLRWQTHYYVVF